MYWNAMLRKMSRGVTILFCNSVLSTFIFHEPIVVCKYTEPTKIWLSYHHINNKMHLWGYINQHSILWVLDLWDAIMVVLDVGCCLFLVSFVAFLDVDLHIINWWYRTAVNNFKRQNKVRMTWYLKNKYLSKILDHWTSRYGLNFGNVVN